MGVGNRDRDRKKGKAVFLRGRLFYGLVTATTTTTTPTHLRQVCYIGRVIVIVMRIDRYYIKRFFGILLCVTFLNCLFAQETLEIDSWRLLDSPLQNEQIQTLLSTSIKNGYTPVGMAVINSSILFLMEKEPMEGAFYLQYISDLDDVNATFLAFAQQGFAPADIAFAGGGLFALFIQTSVPVTGFNIVPEKEQSIIARQRKRSDTFKEMTATGKIPFGLSMQGETLMVGYVTPYRNRLQSLDGEYHIDTIDGC